MAKQKIWMTVNSKAASEAVEEFRDLCEALPEVEEEKLRTFGALIDATWKYLLMFEQRAPGQLANPVHFSGQLLPTQRLQDLCALLKNKDIDGAIDYARNLYQLATRHQPAAAEVGGQCE